MLLRPSAQNHRSRKIGGFDRELVVSFIKTTAYFSRRNDR